MKRIHAFEGLRGYLSWWVVIAHIFLAAGYSPDMVPRGVRILLKGEYAVDVFIILSGFVIFILLGHKGQKYFVFIVQRFFRLFPLLFALLIVGIGIHFVWKAIIDMRFWTFNDKEVLDYTNWILIDSHLWEHFFIHLTMFHGLIPEQMLPRSAIAILGPAWSISLEWQFYLVAPLIFAFLVKLNQWRWLLFTLIVVFSHWIVGPHLDKYFPQRAFILQKLFFFWIGMLSYFLYQYFHDKEDLAYKVGLIFMLGVAPFTFFLTLSIPLTLWVFVFSATLASCSSNQVQLIKWVSACLTHPFTLRLGKISYSVYLAHYFCIQGIHWVLLRMGWVHSRGDLVVYSFPLVVIVVYFVSELAYRYVEVPGMRLGRFLTHSRRPVEQ